VCNTRWFYYRIFGTFKTIFNFVIFKALFLYNCSYSSLYTGTTKPVENLFFQPVISKYYKRETTISKSVLKMSPGKKDNSKNKIWAKEAAIQIGAGGSAGFVEVCTLHPMDLVKTRFQLQVKTKVLDHIYYTGLINYFENNLRCNRLQKIMVISFKV